MTNLFNQCPVHVHAVIVLYKMKPNESVAFNTLQEAISRLPNGKADVKILLYDNTPGGQEIGVLLPGVEYIADFENGGLAKAYNHALEIAHDHGFGWLLTLDQDTRLPIDFMCKLCSTIAFVEPMDAVAAIIPSISSDGRLISPSVPMFHWALTKHFPDGFIGISPSTLTLAINSASTLRVSALKAVGGYDPRFWLDCSDVLMYHRLQSNNFRIFVAGNIHVEHEASVIDLANRVTPDRYANIHSAHEAYFDEYLGRTEGIMRLLKLFYELAKLWKNRIPPPYSKVLFRFICRKLLYSRKHRMETWSHPVMHRSDG